MNVEVINTGYHVTIHGFSGMAVNKDYAGTAFRLMDRMWKIVKAKDLENKGLNIWVYEPGEMVFAGVELCGNADEDSGLEQNIISLPTYAYYKHIGPYSLIKQSAQNMRDELKSMGFETCLPYVEIYGHWTNDETKLETALLMCLK